MSWLYEKKICMSEKNGIITAIRRFGRWQVSVDGCGQTTRYTRAMWIYAIKRLKKIAPQKNMHILMLGMGAGGEIRTLNRIFPNCVITVVEYDQVMIDLAHELNLHRGYPEPTLMYGDAGKVISI